MRFAKAVVGGLTLVCSAASYAAMPAPGHYEGGGAWQMPNGEKGTWSESVDITGAAGGLDVKSALKIFSAGNDLMHSENVELQVRSTDGVFFTVTNNGKQVGKGYCLASMCHQTFANDQEQGEETIVFGADNMQKLGSTDVKGRNDEIWHVVWNGTLVKRS